MYFKYHRGYFWTVLRDGKQDNSHINFILGNLNTELRTNLQNIPGKTLVAPKQMLTPPEWWKEIQKI